MQRKTAGRGVRKNVFMVVSLNELIARSLATCFDDGILTFQVRKIC